jgi:hypothetical protein
MPLNRRGMIEQEDADVACRNLKPLPWAAETQEALARYQAEQPSAEELRKVEAYEFAPEDYFERPHLRVKSLESQLAHMFRTWLQAVEANLPEQDACKVAYAAGLSHGSRRLSTFLKREDLPQGTEMMAMFQDTAHASAGARHASALFARYDDELVEISRTEDSFGAHGGEESPGLRAFFDGFIDGYQQADPALTSVEEMTRKLPNGKVRFIHRFWYRK